MQKSKLINKLTILLLAVIALSCHTPTKTTTSKPANAENSDVFIRDGEITQYLPKEDLVKIYTQAIGDFIKASNEKRKTVFDTLYIGKPQKSDISSGTFPDIELSETIEKTHIRLIPTDFDITEHKKYMSRIYINLQGWANKEKAMFGFFVFLNGEVFQYGCLIKYLYNPEKKEYEIMKIKFKEASESGPVRSH